MESDKIIEKLRRYLEEKEGLDYTSCYFIIKQLEEEYWEDIKNEGDDTTEDSEEDFSDFDEESEESEEEPEKLNFEEETKEKKTENKITKKDNSAIIKKPKIKLVP